MLKKIVGKFRKPKFANLSNEQKVKQFSEKAIGLFDHMKKAHSELATINEELDLIIVSEDQKIQKEIEDHHYKIKQLADNKIRAVDEKNMNTKVQEKLADFIVR
ncbi:hypothetical protein BSK59_15780 [Paenibacillus odorifer]|uniref:hypothetical protein n=1 Tax=Paenibacillus odorifer TaxID=189426 RepID=UPI00096D1D34|nr:hypothetical protein [Paenibacillus odorifer]OME54040.1 hypothetical protein BSK59_15780 [Paenibacillus odorifer]